MGNLGQFFQDDSTQRFSAIRLVFLTWAIVVLATWGFVSLTKGEVKDLPQSVQIVLLTLMGGKVVQKFGENNPNTSGEENNQRDTDSKKELDPEDSSPNPEPDNPNDGPTTTSSNGNGSAAPISGSQTS